MRSSSTPSRASLLKYQIREIVDVAQKIKQLDPAKQFVWENIGDPIAQGWRVPPFLKILLAEEMQKANDSAFGYTHSRGNVGTRQWVAEMVQRLCPSSRLTGEDIVFTNGLGAGIAILYQMLPAGTRVLQPSPTYPTHASFEAFAAGEEPILYRLDPARGWEPDTAHIEEQIAAHPDVVGIVIINPNNPTGAVYSRETLARLVAIAEKRQLMIISDEIYFRMVYNGAVHTHMVDVVAGRVPLIVLRGMSKDVPWPGSRCGWVEFHNTELDEQFGAYVAAIKQRILLEVCATTLPQAILPQVYAHPEFDAWIAANNAELEANGNYITDTLSRVTHLHVTRPSGAFYMMPLFADGVLTSGQTLPIEHDAVRAFIEEKVRQPHTPPDQRFTYYLLGAEGIVTVPASGFYSPYPGFRVTTLDRNAERRRDTYARLSRAVEQYVASK